MPCSMALLSFCCCTALYHSAAALLCMLLPYTCSSPLSCVSCSQIFSVSVPALLLCFAENFHILHALFAFLVPLPFLCAAHTHFAPHTLHTPQEGWDESLGQGRAWEIKQACPTSYFLVGTVCAFGFLAFLYGELPGTSI